jgi:hypothetical protein
MSRHADGERNNSGIGNTLIFGCQQ